LPPPPDQGWKCDYRWVEAADTSKQARRRQRRRRIVYSLLVLIISTAAYWSLS
jgi:hypothetical protein